MSTQKAMQSSLKRIWSLSVSLALFLLLVSSFSTTALASPAAPRQILSGYTIPALNGLAPTGAADDTQTLHLTVSLQLPDRAGLEALIEAQNDPQSPLYHQYLTTQQFADYFAPAQASVDAVVAYLKSQGLTVGNISPNRLSVQATGTVAQVERAFQTQISNYALDGKIVYAPSTAPSVPTSLAGQVLGILGLDNVVVPRWSGTLQPQVSQGVQPNDEPTGGYTPSDIRTAYDMNPLLSGGFDGTGQTVAILSIGGYLASDIDTYRSQYGLGTGSYTTVLVDNATNTPGEGSTELEHQMEILSAAAPEASQRIYIAPASLQGLLDGFNQIVTETNNRAKVVISSWEQCESDFLLPEFTEVYHNIFAQGAAQGQAFFTSTGSNGAYACGGNDLGVDYPASDPYVVAVGGTALYINADGTYSSETTGSCSGCPSNGIIGSGGGGGLSTFYSQPSYQSGPGVINQYSNGMREVPDVSANGSVLTPYSVYCSLSSFCEGWNFTVNDNYLAAALWGGIAADINQFLEGNGSPTLGSASAALYQLFNTPQPFTPYHDVTSGNNLYYPATSGYDLATGMGTPDVWNMARDLDSGYLAVTPSSFAVTAAPNASTTQALTIQNVGLGTYVWQLTNLPSWLSAAANSGSLIPGTSASIPLTFTAPATPQTLTATFIISDTQAYGPSTIVSVTFVVASVSKTWYFAEGYTGGSFAEYLTLENPNNTSNTATVTYLLDGGQSSVIKDYTLAANSRTTIYVKDEIGANKNNSMIVTADQPIIAERPMYFTYTALPGYTIPGGTDVLGATSLSQQFDFGYLDTTAGHDPYLTILNPNPLISMPVQIVYFSAAGIPYVTSHQVPAYSRGTINVRTDEGLPAGTYSAQVTLGFNGLVERPMYFKDSVTNYTGSTDVVGVANPHTDWYFAEGYTNTNFSERYYLSNLNDQSASASVTFFLSDGSTVTDNLTIPARGQMVVDANTVLGQDVNNSAHVNANLPILAERFMSFDYTAAVGDNQHPNIPGATDVLGASAPGNLFYFAEGYDGTGFAEYLTIENPSTTQTATVTVTFYPDDGTTPTVRIYTIGPSTRFTLFTADVMPNAAFSMQVISNSPIVAERPMYFNYLNSGQTGGTDVVGYQP